MRDEIIKRNTIIILISLLLFFIVSLFITSYTSRKSMEQQLINVSTVINNQITETNSQSELEDTIHMFTKNQEWLQIVISNSKGVILIDSSNDAIGDAINSYLGEDELKIIENNIEDDRIYLKDNMICFITKINDDVIVKTSTQLQDNTELILMNLFYLLLLLIGVIIVSYQYSKRLSNNIIGTFNELRSTLKSINEGNYAEVNPEHEYEEVQDILDEINEINNNTYLSMLTIRNEHEKLDFVINNMQQGILIVNKTGGVLLINDYAKNALGVANIQSAEVNYKDIIINEVLLEKIEKAIVNKNDYYFDIKDDNKSRIYACTINYLKNKWSDLNKDERLYVIVIMDVTDDRENDKIKADFISNVSHELKTPITSIRGFSELLLVRNEDSDEKTRKYLNVIYNESIKMKDTIEELLYLSNLQHERNNKSSYCEFYFADIVEEVISDLRELISKKQVSINVECEEVLIYEQEKLVYHMIKNLVENAVKYNKENGTVKISVRNEKRKVVLTVSDTGVGIEQKHLDKIFDRFYRVDESRNRNTGGTGIGLNIVKQICKTINAKISVESVVDEGTTFTVVFNKER